MRHNSIRCNNSYEMDTKIEIKEDPVLYDIASQIERKFLTKNVAMKTVSDAVPLDVDCDMAIKTEVKSEIPFPDFYSEKERDCFMKYLIKQIKCETVSYSNNCKIDTKINISPQNEREFLPVDPVMKVNKYNGVQEVGNKIEIKEEPWWLETETSSVCNDIKDGHFTPVKPPRLCTEAVSGDCSGDSSLPSAEASGKNANFRYGKNCLECESDVTKISPVEKLIHSEQSGKCSDGEEIYSRALFIHKGKRSHKCSICDKSFTRLSHLKKHNLIHEGKKPHKCENCERSFTLLSNLKKHNLIHEGKKPHKCEICEKGFRRLSHLKTHNLIHEGKKLHKCEICEKSFTVLSYLKKHNLIHKGKKLHWCDICEHSFTLLSNLKRHNLIHEGKKPHKCEICEKRFTSSSNLKRHHLIHEGKKPCKR